MCAHKQLPRLVFGGFESEFFSNIRDCVLVPALLEKNSVKPESHVSVDAVGGVDNPLVDSGN